MRLLAALLLLLPASQAGAFLFWGGPRYGKAEAELAAMKKADARGDCSTVLGMAAGFLSLTPPSELREEAYVYIGRCYEREGATDKAITLYKLAGGLYPSNVLFAARLAQIYDQAGFYQNAVPLFLKVLAAEPGEVQANLGLARAYSALGFLSRADDFYSRTVALQNFSDAAVLEEYARCMLRKRDWKEALFLAGKGEARRPRSPVWPLLEARATAGKGDYSGAVSLMGRAETFSPSRKLRLERALYLLLGGSPRRAIEEADRELAADPSDPLASVVKAMALYNLGKEAEAERYFEAALAGGPFTARLAAAFLPGPSRKEAGCEK